jgi:hypothetical protein
MPPIWEGIDSNRIQDLGIQSRNLRSTGSPIISRRSSRPVLCFIPNLCVHHQVAIVPKYYPRHGPSLVFEKLFVRKSYVPTGTAVVFLTAVNLSSSSVSGTRCAFRSDTVARAICRLAELIVWCSLNFFSLHAVVSLFYLVARTRVLRCRLLAKNNGWGIHR